MIKKLKFMYLFSTSREFPTTVIARSPALAGRRSNLKLEIASLPSVARNDKSVPSGLNKYKFIFIFFALVFAGGCAQVTETTKAIWGSSTRALENARVEAIAKTYRCSFNDCYDSVLTLSRAEPVYVKKYNEEGEEIDDEGNVKEPDPGGFFDVFINNRKKQHIVVIGIEGNVDTTEVGIFFSQPGLTTVKLEVSSLSSSAKRKVAQAVFDELDLRFSSAE